MAEYIEREALRKKFFTDTRFGFYGEFTDGSETAYTSAEVNAIIVNAPTADVVEVRHGKWLKTEEPMGWHDVDCIECSACHGSWVIADDVSFEDYVEGWKYCPNCGAKMDGKDDNDG